MAQSGADRDFVDHVLELMQVIGPVDDRRMFGGYGLFLDGLMFALIADSELYLKVDDESRADFERQALQEFSYQKQDKVMRLGYYQAPEEALEDAAVMLEWANRGFAAALRAARRKRAESGRARGSAQSPGG